MESSDITKIVSLQALYEHTFESIFRYCKVRTKHIQEAEDMTQDIYIRYANKYGNTLSLSEGTKVLFGIAKRCFWEWIKNQYKQKEEIDLGKTWILYWEPPTEEHSHRLDNLKEILLTEIKKLPGKQQVVCEMFYSMNRTRKQIANHLNMSEDSVHTYIKRGTKQLKKAIAVPPSPYLQ
jgi:RNA polymerase sigma-70 factor, ECF subfamily